MLEVLITSKIHLKLLRRFFPDSRISACLPLPEPEFDESADTLRQKLNRFEENGLMAADKKKFFLVYHASTQQLLFSEINDLRMKYKGIEKEVRKPGKPTDAHLVGEPAKGKGFPIIDRWFVGEAIDKNYLLELMVKVEDAFKRKLYYISSGIELLGFMKAKNKQGLLLLWEK